VAAGGMSWLELDDRILEHPKFIRAVKLGGSEAVHLWLGIRSYCGQNLTNGKVPADMIDELRGPIEPQGRAKALEVLISVGLLIRDGEEILMHNYLKWSSSRNDVLKRRKQARERQAKSRVASRCMSRRDSEETSSLVTERRGGGGGGGSLSASEPEVIDHDRETICPMNLTDRAADVGVFLELSKYLNVSEADLLEEARQFVAYWVIGQGMGKKRSHWMAKLRQRLIERAQEGKLPKSGIHKSAAVAANDYSAIAWGAPE
jgi:hypothetical protein